MALINAAVKHMLSKKTHNVHIYGIAKLLVSLLLFIVRLKRIRKTLQSCALSWRKESLP